MLRMRGFLLGVAVGAVGAALLLLVLVLGFDFGEGEQTSALPPIVIPAADDLPAGSGLSPSQLYSRVSGGVVMVRATFPASGGWSPWGIPR